MDSFGEQNKIRELEELLLRQKMEHEATLNEKVHKIRAKSLRFAFELKIGQKKLQNCSRENQDLTKENQILKKRINALQTEADVLSRNHPIKYVAYSQKKEQIILKRHAGTLTEDSDFPFHTKFSRFYAQLPMKRPLLLVGFFEDRNSFKKISAYVADDNEKIVPYDFPYHSIAIPTTRNSSTSTVANIKEVHDKEYIEITPNIIREIEVEEIVHYNRTVPITIMAGIYSMILGGTAYRKITRASQTNAARPVLVVTDIEKIAILSKKPSAGQVQRKKMPDMNSLKRKATIGTSAATRETRKISGSNYPYSLLKQSISPPCSRTNSVNSLSFSSSKDIRPTSKGKTTMTILAEEMAKLTQNLDEITINGGTFEDFLNDEQYQTQSKKVKSLIEKLQKRSVLNKQEDTFLSPPGKFTRKHSNRIDPQIEQLSGSHVISTEDSHLSSRSKEEPAKSSRLPKKGNVKFLSLAKMKHKKETSIPEDPIPEDPILEDPIPEEKPSNLSQTLQFSQSELPEETIISNPDFIANSQQEVSIRMLTHNTSLTEERKHKGNQVRILELETKPESPKPSTTEENIQNDLNSTTKPPETNITAGALPSAAVRVKSASFSSVSIPRKLMATSPTGIQAFIFSNKKPKLEIRHPGPAFLKNYLLHLSQQPSLHSPTTLSYLLKIITESYMAKLHAIKETNRNRALPLSAVLYDLLHKKYGLKSVAEQKMKHVILGCLAFSAKSTRVKGFERFLGISEECSVGDFNFYIECIEFTNYNVPRSLLVNGTVLGKQSVLYERLVPFIEFYFRTKLPSDEYNELSRELHELKISSVLRNQATIETLDLDKGFSVMLRYFQRIVMRICNYLQVLTGSSWEGDKTFTYDEFLTVILQLRDMPEGLLTSYFAIYKEKSEITKREAIALEPLLLFVIDNSLLDFLKSVQF